MDGLIADKLAICEVVEKWVVWCDGAIGNAWRRSGTTMAG